MKPKQNFLEWLFHRRPPFEGNVEDIFDARKMIPSDVPNPYPEYTYFVIFTRVLVGDYGKNKIKNVHIRFRFEGLSSDLPIIQLHSISPSKESLIVGSVKGMKSISEGRKVDSGATAEARISGLVYGTVSGSITKKNESDEISTYEYPNSKQISSGGVAGNVAKWDFKQGGPAGTRMQYDLQIIFYINDPLNAIKGGKGLYLVNWNIRINDRELMDHGYKKRQPRNINFIL